MEDLDFTLVAIAIHSFYRTQRVSFYSEQKIGQPVTGSAGALARQACAARSGFHFLDKFDVIVFVHGAGEGARAPSEELHEPQIDPPFIGRVLTV